MRLMRLKTIIIVCVIYFHSSYFEWSIIVIVILTMYDIIILIKVLSKGVMYT
jgi:hypothetical protein